MPESWHTRWLRWKMKLFPAWRGTGATVTYIAGDFRELRVKLPLSWRTRNYVGTIFGGSRDRGRAAGRPRLQHRFKGCGRRRTRLDREGHLHSPPIMWSAPAMPAL